MMEKLVAILITLIILAIGVYLYAFHPMILLALFVLVIGIDVFSEVYKKLKKNKDDNI